MPELLQMIGTVPVVRMYAANCRFCGRHLRQLQVFIRRYTLPDMDAIITLENKGDLICSKPLAAVGVNMEDQRRNILILLDGGGGAAEKCL